MGNGGGGGALVPLWRGGGGGELFEAGAARDSAGLHAPAPKVTTARSQKLLQHWLSFMQALSSARHVWPPPAELQLGCVSFVRQGMDASEKAGAARTGRSHAGREETHRSCAGVGGDTRWRGIVARHGGGTWRGGGGGACRVDGATRRAGDISERSATLGRLREHAAEGGQRRDQQQQRRLHATHLCGPPAAEAAQLHGTRAPQRRANRSRARKRSSRMASGAAVKSGAPRLSE